MIVPFNAFAHHLPVAISLEPSGAEKAHALNRGRTAAVALTVAGLHATLIWALLTALESRPVEIFVPVEMVAELIAPPAPRAAPAMPAPPPPAPAPPPNVPKPAPAKKAAVKTPAPPARKAVPAPQPLAVTVPVRLFEAASPAPATPAMPVPTASLDSAKAEAAAAASAGPAASAAPQGSSASAAVQLPSSDAAYLQNPAPPYPALSKRMGERGKTVVRVLIGADGEPQKAELAASSGFERLDNASIAAVMRWRFVPGKRGGVPETMWFNVPIKWELQN